MFIASIKRELLVAVRNPSNILNPLFFFLLVVSLFPLGIGPDEETLRTIAPGVLWVAALLATLLSMESLFRSDEEDGSLDQMLVSGQPFILAVSGKILVHWLVTGLPLVILSPVLGLMLAVNETHLLTISLSLLLGTPVLSMMGAIGASLTIGLGRGGVLISVLVLPLYVPVLILGTLLIQTAQLGGDYAGYVYWMLALLALTLGVAPIATAAGVRLTRS